MSHNRPRHRPPSESGLARPKPISKGATGIPLDPAPETPVHVQIAAQVRSLRRIGYDHGRIAERLGLDREEVGRYAGQH